MNVKRFAHGGTIVALATVITFSTVAAQQQEAGDSGEATATGNLTMSEAEAATLITMIDEEKLAHDVYVTLDEATGHPVFTNISAAESRHMSAVRRLAEQYNLVLPKQNDSIGEFMDLKFAELYKELVASGQKSKLDAVKAGARIEDLDIADLKTAIAASTRPDVQLVYENLQRASRNHLRAFSRQLRALGGTYEAQYLSQAEFDRIAASANEPGGRGCALCGQAQSGQGRGVGFGRANGTGQGKGLGRGAGLGRGNGPGRGNSPGKGRGRGRGAVDNQDR